MTYKWDILPLGEVAEIIGGGTPSTKEAKFWDGEVPWITPKDLSGHGSVFIAAGERSISIDGLAKSSAKLIPANSVLYTSRAPIGYVAINPVPVTTNQGFKSFVPKAGFDYKYLYYLLKNSKKEILAYASGGTFAEIGATAISEVQLPFPPLGVQRAIGTTLLNLDLAIEANQRIALLLEQIAQTIFKSWFVDFEPVHAKIRGEQPEGMDDVTAALFPKSFEGSEIGGIPAGWRMGELQEVVTLVKSTVKAGASTISKPYVPIDVIRSKSLFLHAVAPSEDAKTSLLEFKHGDVLFGAMRPYFHKVCIAPFNGITRSTIFVLRPNAHKAFSALYLSQDSTVDFATTHSQGSTIPYAVWLNGLAEMEVVLPATSVLDAFEKIVSPIIELGERLFQQNKTLAEIRDSLLPRLISGELEVPEELLGE